MQGLDHSLKQMGRNCCRQAVNNTMQKFGLKTTKSKRARRETEAEEEAEAALQFKVGLRFIAVVGACALLYASALKPSMQELAYTVLLCSIMSHWQQAPSMCLLQYKQLFSACISSQSLCELAFAYMT